MVRVTASCDGRAPLRTSRAAWARLSYSPGSKARSCVISASLILVSSLHAPRAASIAPTAAAAKRRLSIRGPPLRAVLQPEAHEALEQLPVGCAGGRGGGCEILRGLQIRVGISLQHVHLSLRGGPEIHASIAGHAKAAIDAA